MSGLRYYTGFLLFILLSYSSYAQSSSDTVPRFVQYGTPYDTVINEILDVYKVINKDHLEFIQKDIKTTMATRPKLNFIFRKKIHRVYRIFIDTVVEDSNGLLVEYLPRDALVGILAHEFAHIIDYENRSNSGIIRLGMNYSSTRGRVDVENRVDSITMEYGFVDESIAFAEFLARTGLVSKEYKEYKARFYNSVDDLKAMAMRITARKNKEQRKKEREAKKEKRQEEKAKKNLEKVEKKIVKEAEKEIKKEIKEAEKLEKQHEREEKKAERQEKKEEKKEERKVKKEEK